LVEVIFDESILLDEWVCDDFLSLSSFSYFIFFSGISFYIYGILYEFILSRFIFFNTSKFSYLVSTGLSGVELSIDIIEKESMFEVGDSSNLTFLKVGYLVRPSLLLGNL